MFKFAQGVWMTPHVFGAFLFITDTVLETHNLLPTMVNILYIVYDTGLSQTMGSTDINVPI